MSDTIIGPKEVVLVTTRSRIKSRYSIDIIEKDDIGATSWHSPVSKDPKLYLVAFPKNSFHSELILESRVFVVNFISEDLKFAADFCFRHEGEHVDEFKETSLTMANAKTLDCCRIKEAIGFIECEVLDVIEAGDHVLFIGKVTNIEKVRDEKRLYQSNENVYTTTID